MKNFIIVVSLFYISVYIFSSTFASASTLTHTSTQRFFNCSHNTIIDKNFKLGRLTGEPKCDVCDPKAEYALEYNDKFKEMNINVPLILSNTLLNSENEPYFTNCIVEEIENTTTRQCFRDNCTLDEWCTCKGNCQKRQIYSRTCSILIIAQNVGIFRRSCMCFNPNDVAFSPIPFLLNNVESPLPFSDYSSVYCFTAGMNSICSVTTNGALVIKGNMTVQCIPGEGFYASDCGCSE